MDEAIRNVMKVLLVTAFLLGAIFFGQAMDFGYQLAKASDVELIHQLGEGPSERQVAILYILNERYRVPGELIVHGKVPYQEAYPLEKPLDPLLVPAVFQVAKADPTVGTRIAAVDLMGVLHTRTNITGLFEILVADPNTKIRLLACSAVVEHSKKCHMLVPCSVVNSLSECLVPTNSVANLRTALTHIAEFGSAVSNCEHQVELLTKISSKEVRKEARKALRAIRSTSMEQ